MEKKWITAFKIKVTVKFKMSVNVCHDDIFCTSENFVTKFGMVMQHHEPVSCRRRRRREKELCPGLGNSEGSYDQNNPDIILCGWLGSKHQLTETMIKI